MFKSKSSTVLTLCPRPLSAVRVGASSSARSYSNLLQKWRNKWSALELLINLEQLLTWVHTHTHTAKRAAVVSQNVRQEPPEASDVMSGAVGSNRSVSEELVWKLIQHESPCRCSEEAQPLTSPTTFSFIGQSWSHIPPPGVRGDGFFLLCHASTWKTVYVFFFCYTCRLTWNQKLDASWVVKLKRWSGRSLQTEVGARHWFQTRWSKVGIQYRWDGGSSITSWGLSTAQWSHWAYTRGERGSGARLIWINVLWLIVQLVSSSTVSFSRRKLFDYSMRVGHLALLTSMSSFFLSPRSLSPRSWFTPQGVVPRLLPEPFLCQRKLIETEYIALVS